MNWALTQLMHATESRALKRTFVMISLLLTLASLWFVPWTMLKMALRPLPATIQEQLNYATAQRFDGVVLYMNQAGQESIFASGWNDEDAEVVASPDALFKIASITKLYVAVVVAKLVNRGQLSLDETVADYLPHLATKFENADQITLRMLVQHRSGIPSYTEAPDYPWHDPSLPTGDVIAIISGQSALFEPGTRRHYSNTNYHLIGEIIRTLGHDYGHFIRQDILSPLNLSRTFISVDQVDSDDLMSGYVLGQDQDWKGVNFDSPAGSIVASAQDVGLFLRALVDGTLMTPEEQTLYSELYAYGHTGLLPGYSSIARYHNELDVVVVQFVNTSGNRMWGEVETNYRRVLRILSADL